MGRCTAILLLIAVTAAPGFLGPEPSRATTPTPVACVGDCNGDGVVRINELIAGLNIDLYGESFDACPAFNCNTGPPIYIDCLIIAVRNALNGCTQPTPAPPHLSLGVQVSTSPDQHQISIVADLAHLGGSVVSYVTGCTAECYPQFTRPIAFDVSGPDGPVIIDNCGSPTYCPEYFMALSPGEALQQTLSVTGTSFGQRCDPYDPYVACTEADLAPGHYTVTARFTYRIGPDWAAPEYEFEETVGFDWPPTGSPSETPQPSPTPTPTDQLPTGPPTHTPLSCFDVEFVYGCCDFYGQRPCYTLSEGSYASDCMYRDYGNPRGCFGSVICNASSGLCESTTPVPTRTCPGSPPPTCSPGEGLTCQDTQCHSGCRCGTVTPTPTLATPSKTVTILA